MYSTMDPVSTLVIGVAALLQFAGFVSVDSASCSDGGFTCDAGRVYDSSNSSFDCSDGNTCTDAQCCTAGTCGNTNYACQDADWIRVAANDDDLCSTGTNGTDCDDDVCCALSCTDSTFTCDSGRGLTAAAATTVCPSNICSDFDCCTAGTCDNTYYACQDTDWIRVAANDDDLCSTGANGTDCDDDLCCALSCTESTFTCDPGNVLYDDAAATICTGGTCTDGQCCTAAYCVNTYFVCNNVDWIRDPNDDYELCTSGNNGDCDDDLCCALSCADSTFTCSYEGEVLIDDAASTLCGNTCEDAVCCVTDQPEEGEVVCTAEAEACEADQACQACLTEPEAGAAECALSATSFGCAGTADLYCCIYGEACSDNALLLAVTNCGLEEAEVDCTLTEFCSGATGGEEEEGEGGEVACTTEAEACEADEECSACLTEVDVGAAECQFSVTSFGCSGLAELYCCSYGEVCSDNALLLAVVNCGLEDTANCALTEFCSGATEGEEEEEQEEEEEEEEQEEEEEEATCSAEAAETMACITEGAEAEECAATATGCDGAAELYCCMYEAVCSNNTLLQAVTNCDLEEQADCTLDELCTAFSGAMGSFSISSKFTVFGAAAAAAIAVVVFAGLPLV